MLKNKKETKKALFIALPIIAIGIPVAVGTTAIVLKHKNNQNIDIKKNETTNFSISKNTNGWQIFLKTKDNQPINNSSKEIEFTNEENESITFKASWQKVNNDNFWVININDLSIPKKGSYSIQIPSDITLVEKTENIKINFPFFEIKNTGKKGELEIFFTNILNSNSITYTLENIENTNINKTKNITIVNNSLKIDIPNDLVKGKYLLKKLYFNPTDNLIDNHFLELNKEKLTISNLNFGQIIENKLIINLETLNKNIKNPNNFNNFSLIFENRNNEVKKILGTIEEKNLSFDLNQLSDKYVWNILQLEIANSSNEQNKIISNYKDFSESIKNYYKAEKKEVSLENSFVTNKSSLLFINDPNNWIDLSSQKFKIKHYNKNKELLEEVNNFNVVDLKKKAVLFEFKNSFQTEDFIQVEYSNNEINLNKNKFIFNKNTIETNNLITVQKEENKLDILLKNNLETTSSSEIKASFVVIDEKNHITTNEEKILHLIDKNKLEIMLNDSFFEANKTYYLSSIEFINNASHMLIPFANKKITKISTFENNITNINILKRETINNITYLHFELPNTYLNNELNHLFSIIINNKEYKGYTDLNTLTFYINDNLPESLSGSIIKDLNSERIFKINK
ncbi:hypothetical protein ACR34G_01740 [Mycoplasma sp. 480]|uniref:hypothetical protein n=1 Tax=Mycoplasma sp. 480 TaxID=3440155 RepID=UPI003F51569A